MTLSSEPRPLDLPADSGFAVESFRRPGCTSFTVMGALTTRSVTMLESLIRREVDHASPGDHLRIDLNGCTQLSTAVIRTLGKEQDYCAERDVVLYLARVPDPLVKQVEDEHASSLLQPPWV